jgi:hypothetical protein
MRCLVKSYFKDEADEWHQPGNVDNFNRGEAEGLQKKGYIKIIETAAVEQPETRTGGENEAHHDLGRKRNSKYRKGNSIRGILKPE